VGLGMESMLVYFMAVMNILRPFVDGNLVYFIPVDMFFPFWYAAQRKIWQPCRPRQLT
jgi:hypothetical protein